ncbi:hypothetical protein YC2023_051111 [Brassica napus]
MDFDKALKRHVLAHIRSIFFTFQSPGRGYIKRQSKFQSKTLFSYLRVNKSLFRWTCASYQATFRNLSFGELVNHIKYQLKSGSIIGPSATHCVTNFERKLLCDHLNLRETRVWVRINT